MKVSAKTRLDLLRVLWTYLVINVLVDAVLFMLRGHLDPWDTAFTWTLVVVLVWVTRRTHPHIDRDCHEVVA